jgi:hypothetical protein
MRVISCPTRLPGETGEQFVTRLLRQLEAKTNGHVASATATDTALGRKAMDGGDRPAKRMQVAGPVLDTAGGEQIRGKVPKRAARVRPSPAPRSLGATVTDERPTTTKWPPNRGERYVGVWPPRALYDRAKRTRELCKPMPKSTRYVVD